MGVAYYKFIVTVGGNRPIGQEEEGGEEGGRVERGRRRKVKTDRRMDKVSI